MPTALIWGASGAIGRAFAQHLSDNEWTVIGVSRHPEDITDICDHTCTADVTDIHQVQEAVHQIGMETGGEVDLVVYAAGDITHMPVEELEPADWQRIIGANLTGPYLTTHHAEPLLATDATLIYIGAMSENLQLPGLSAYSAAKAGLESFCESLRKEARKKTVLCIRPGAVDTPFWEKVPMNVPKKALSPEEVVTATMEAVENGEKGLFDIS